MLNALIFGRAFLQVVLVAGNTVQLAAYQRTGDLRTLIGATLVGCLISWVWWGNARSTSRDDKPASRWAYTLGAGVGTIVGASFVAWWYR